MALDLDTFSVKLKRCREQLQLSIEEMVIATGVDQTRLLELEAAKIPPTGDEVLIFADFYKCDYRFFISNERLASFEQTDTLFRRYGTEFSKPDRWSVREFLFLCECEYFLEQSLQRHHSEFNFYPDGNYFKGHAESAAKSLRKHLGYAQHEVAADVYRDFRKIGVHVFRRHLDNSNISGLTIRHPFAGVCILVNYSEDIYRQRFTAAHEAAHAILDSGEDVIVSFSRFSRDLIEIRANTFASRYLLPPELLATLTVHKWNKAAIATWASKLNVSAIALAIGLKENNLITESEFSDISKVRVRADLKNDPELAGITAKSFERKRALLARGLSIHYVSLCFDSLASGQITNARAAEMLLTSETELAELARLFNVGLVAAHE